MLIRRLIAVAVLAGFAGIAAPATALAAPASPPSGGGDCDQNPDPSCVVWGGGGGGNGGGGNGGGGGGGSGGGCTWQGQNMPCSDPDYGYYMGGGCYWQVLDPPPAADPPPGDDPAKGAWGTKTCYAAPGGGAVTQVYYWMDNPNARPTPA